MFNSMNVFKLLTPYFIFNGIICAFHHGAYPKKWQNFVNEVSHWKNKIFDERLSTQTDAIENVKRKRSLHATEPLSEQECPEGRRTLIFEELFKCPFNFCQHVSYKCDIRCSRQETGDNCGLYNCAGSHHCPYSHTIPLQEVCDDKSQCPDSDEESVCVHPCQPSCTCVGLIVNFSDPSQGTVRAPFNILWNDSISPGILHLSNIDYLVITDIDELYKTFFNGLQSLRSLDLSNNGIVSLPEGLFDDMSSLVSLNLSYNKINQLPTDVFHGLSGLEMLLLSNNIISVLHDTVLRGFPVLELLDLSNNQISILPDQVFRELPVLMIVYLSNNQISVLPDKVFRDLPVLNSLDLSNNQISVLPDKVFRDLPVLELLDLSNNQLAVLPDQVFRELPVLRILYMSNNQISVLPDKVFRDLPVLNSLDLSNNQISVLPDKVFRDLPVLELLDLSNNQLAVLPDQVFRELPVLRILYMSNNQISVLPDKVFRDLPVLMILDMSNNQITSLPTLSASVESLDISYNDFSHLTFSTFTNYSNLSFLDIIGNKLKVKQHMFEGLDNLTVLLTDTPFMCCVKPKSVAEDRCLNRQNHIFHCMFEPDTCKSEEDMISSCDNLIGSDLLRVFLWIIGVCALIGNFAVMFYRLLIDRDNIRRSYSIFVLNLSVSDFLMGIYLMIIGTFDVNYRDMYAWNDQDWRKSIICTIAGIVSNVSSEMSTFLILMVTIDRAIVIVSPMSRLSRRNISWKQACLISFFLWLVAITIAIIPAVSLQFYFKNEYYSQSGVCLALPLTGDEQPGSEYSFAVFVCLNSFVFVIIAIGQLCMFKSLMTSGGSRVASSLTRQRDMTAARTLFLVVATDFFCWFPIGVMGLMSKSGYKISNDAYAWVMVFVLPVNAAINPFLYTVSAIWRKRQRAR